MLKHFEVLPSSVTESHLELDHPLIKNATHHSRRLLRIHRLEDLSQLATVSQSTGPVPCESDRPVASLVSVQRQVEDEADRASRTAWCSRAVWGEKREHQRPGRSTSDIWEPCWINHGTNRSADCESHHGTRIDRDLGRFIQSPCRYLQRQRSPKSGQHGRWEAAWRLAKVRCWSLHTFESARLRASYD